MRAAALALGAALALVACQKRPVPLAAMPRYTIGGGYEVGGRWYYPRESFSERTTGLAELLPDRTGLTADGEAFDSTAMAGAHRTLQLPAIAAVTNLENGRQVRIRLNDRGPANPGRLIAITARAADRLGIVAGAPAQVRLEVESSPSQALRDQLQGGPAGITAAPRDAVLAESLPAPGASRAGPPRLGEAIAPARLGQPDQTVPNRLPETVRQSPAQPGQLWIRAGRFSGSPYADALRARLLPLPVEIRREDQVRTPAFVVMAGPFGSVAAADAALDQAHGAGVTDAVLVVE